MTWNFFWQVVATGGMVSLMYSRGIVWRWLGFICFVLAAIDGALDIPEAISAGDAAWAAVECAWVVSPFLAWPYVRREKVSV